MIQDGDMLASIARDEYGAEKFWSAIVEANPGLDPSKLRVGQTINLPPKDAVLKRNSTGSAAAGTNTPTRGDGTPTRSDATPGRSGTAPPVVPTSTRPAGNANNSTPRAVGRRYSVAKGDTLMSISRRVLKDANRWKEIYELNKDKLSSPNALKEGMELKLPADSAGDTNATPTGGTNSSANPNPRGGNTPGTRTPERRPTTRPAGSPR